MAAPVVADHVNNFIAIGPAELERPREISVGCDRVNRVTAPLWEQRKNEGSTENML